MAARIDSIKTIIRSGKHLLNIINSILDLSKIEADKLEVENCELKIEEVVNEVYLISRQTATEKKLNFKVEYKLPLPLFIHSDPVRLEQILLNLCSNAIKFTEQGGVILRIEYSQKTGKLCFKVIDTGIGIDAENIEKIFVAFEQADSSTTRRYGGTGLGLHLSRKLARILNADIEVSSTPASGSVFSLIINTGILSSDQMMKAVPAMISHDQEKNDSPENSYLSGCILLAEDNPDNQRLICLYLNRLGVECDVAENGKVAVEKMQNKKYSMVLMDMQMPVMGGLEAVQIIRRFNSETPIVALTANVMQHEVETYVRNGCNGFIAKPINRDRFNDTVRSFLPVAESKDEDLQPILSTLLEEGPGVISLIKLFIERMPVLLQEIHEKYEQKDWYELGAKIHNLKGTGGNYGYMDVTEVAQKIEFLLAKHGYSEIETELENLDYILKRIELGTASLGA
jgi:CheY-like chemotaxis protein/anti-sigma regulatory factor (Ser/Thr protein kinase)